MRTRTVLLLVALGLLLAAPTALAGGQNKGKGKSAEKSMKPADRQSQQHESGEAADDMGEAAEDRDGAGRAKSEEMRSRRDERKAIKEEYKSSAEPGTPRKGKKPWWRFWESDAEVAPELGAAEEGAAE